MRDDDDGEPRGAQRLFEPLDAFDVEVVCRLVEQQDVGSLNDSLDEREAFAPAPAETCSDGGERCTCGAVVGEASASECLAKPLLLLVGGNGSAIHRALDDLADGDLRRELRHLLDVGDGGAAAHGDLAAVRLLLVGKQREESRLAGAVGADEADAVAIVDREGEILKERRRAEALGDRLSCQDWSHRTANSPVTSLLAGRRRPSGSLLCT